MRAVPFVTRPLHPPRIVPRSGPPADPSRLPHPIIMPFSISTDDGIMRIVLSGTLTPEDLGRVADAIGEAEDAADVCPHRVTDLTALTRFEVGFDDMSELARRRREQPPANPIRSAIVAAAPVQIGFARMLQTLNDHPRITMRIFPDVDGALAWLAEEPPAPSV
jgi:hypothetical protein